MSMKPKRIAPSQTQQEALMETMYYIGLDVHKKTIPYCIKNYSGKALDKEPYLRIGVPCWGGSSPLSRHGSVQGKQPCLLDGFMIFSNRMLEMLTAITAAKKKNDRSDAENRLIC
jgi:hypothetical protein